MTRQPEGDVWAIRNEDKNSLDYGRIYYFDFTAIAREDMKILMKEFAWHEQQVKNRTLATVSKNIRDLRKTFNRFMVVNEIQSIRDLTVEDIEKFQTFLKLSLNEKGQPYKVSTIATTYSAVHAMISWGQIHRKDLVPENNVFLGTTSFRRNRKPRIDYIPDEIMVKVNASLSCEENIYIRNAIIILKYTGMRLGELVSLKTDCLKEHLINGYTLRWMDFKNRKERNPVPVHKECADAILELLSYTKEIRFVINEKDRDFLFIRRTKCCVKRIERGQIGSWMRKFTIEHDIRGNDGEIYNLASHQFRRTLATDMFSNGVNIKVVQDTLGHASVVTTAKYYADVKDKQRIAMFKTIGIIGNVKSVDESIIADADELDWFKENVNTAAKMCDGYCTRPVKNGEICERLLKKQKCLTCSRFITTPEYLETHKQHLQGLEQELEYNTFGNHYAEHLIPTVEALREIIDRLETLQNGTTGI